MKTRFLLILLLCIGACTSPSSPEISSTDPALPRSTPEAQSISSEAILAFIEAGDIYTVKLCLYETPFYSTLTFRFDGAALVFDAEHNASFGQTGLSKLTGYNR